MNMDDPGNSRAHELKDRSLKTAPAWAVKTPALTLAEVTDNAALSTLAPRLQNILSNLNQRDGSLLQHLSDNISRLQDAFVEAIYSCLEGENLDLSQKITLRLNRDQALSLAVAHPDEEKIELLLDRHPELSAAFKEIASQSEILRDMSNIEKLIGIAHEDSLCRELPGQAAPPGYQVSIKGEMSHFYFGR